MNRNDVHRFELVLPPPELRQVFEQVVGAWWRRHTAAECQSRTLAALRDALLPRLLSGELRVRDAAKLTGEVLA